MYLPFQCTCVAANEITRTKIIVCSACPTRDRESSLVHTRDSDDRFCGDKIADSIAAMSTFACEQTMRCCCILTCVLPRFCCFVAPCCSAADWYRCGCQCCCLPLRHGCLSNKTYREEALGDTANVDKSELLHASWISDSIPLEEVLEVRTENRKMIRWNPRKINILCSNEAILCRGKCDHCKKEFVPGDKVSWSHNEECKHVYHGSCIVKVLSMSESDVGLLSFSLYPCPRCRRDYMDDQAWLHFCCLEYWA